MAISSYLKRMRQAAARTKQKAAAKKKQSYLQRIRATQQRAAQQRAVAQRAANQRRLQQRAAQQAALRSSQQRAAQQAQQRAAQQRAAAQRATAQPASRAGQSLAKQYAAPVKKLAPKIPQWENVLPWEKLWGGVEQPMTEAAYSQVTPELQRQYKGALRNYMAGMAGSGGGQFGRGWGGVGDLQARAERQRKEQASNWLDTYRNTMKEWYGQTGQQYEKARSGGTQYDYKVPTWQEMAKQVAPMGGTPQTGSQWMQSPFIGNQPMTQQPVQAQQPAQAQWPTRPSSLTGGYGIAI